MQFCKTVFFYAKCHIAKLANPSISMVTTLHHSFRFCIRFGKWLPADVAIDNVVDRLGSIAYFPNSFVFPEIENSRDLCCHCWHYSKASESLPHTN